MDVKYKSLAEEIAELGDKYKHITKKYNNESMYLDPALYTILRLDGHKFSTFTKPFDKPCDKDICQAMQKASIDVLKNFNGLSAYTQSDEVTILLPTASILFNGRRQKIESLSASLMSVRFNHYLMESINKETCKPAKLYKVINHLAYFDSRAIQCSEEDIYDIFRWRQLDGFRNGVSQIFRAFFSAKDAFHLSTKNQIELIKKLENFDINKYPTHLLHGSWIKKRHIVINNVVRNKYYIIDQPQSFIIHPTPKTEYLLLKKLDIEDIC